MTLSQSSHKGKWGLAADCLRAAFDYFQRSAITASDSKRLHIAGASFGDGPKLSSANEDHDGGCLANKEKKKKNGEFIRSKNRTSCDSHVMLFIAAVKHGRNAGRERERERACFDDYAHS